MKGVVVGRTAIDAYLLNYVKQAENGMADVVDVTDSRRKYISRVVSSSLCDSHDGFPRK